MTELKNAIDDMAARSLRCVALAYRTFEADKIPADEEQLSSWVLPDDDLVLLAIVGIKVTHYLLLVLLVFLKSLVMRLDVVL